MLVRFAIEKKSIITSIERIINKRLVIIIDGPCNSIIRLASICVDVAIYLSCYKADTEKGKH